MSNHLDLRSVWKSLVASCVCVAELRMRVFNSFVSSTKVFVSGVKRVRLQHNNAFVFYLEVGLETPQKEKKLGKKVSVKLDFKLGMDLKKVQKQGRDERMQEDYPTSHKTTLHLTNTRMFYN